RPGYSWQGNYYRSGLKRDFERLFNASPDRRNEVLPKSAPSLTSLKQRADQAIREMDEQGRWLSTMSGSTRDFYLEKYGNDAEVPPLIRSGDFVHYAEGILDYLQAVKEEPTGVKAWDQ